jgi:hypothetical protein
MINTSCGPLLKSWANRFLEGVDRTFFTMFGNLFKRLAPGRAVKANPTCDSPGPNHCRMDWKEEK